MDKKILVTGISGFAGNYLARKLLDRGYNKIYGTYLSEKSIGSLFGISSQLELFQLDLMDSKTVYEVINKIKPDYVYHLAAIASSVQSFKEPNFVITNNISSQLNLLEAVRKLGLSSRVMVISSAEVYGKVNPVDLPIDENTPLKPANPYAVSKLTQDFMGLQYNIAYNIDIIRVKPFNHIGPGQSEQFSTSAFAKKIAEIEKGKSEPVLSVGNLEAKRDFTNVEDMVWAYILLMEKGKSGDVYNIGSGKAYKMSEILNMMLSFSSAKIKVETDLNLLRPSDNPELICDNTKIHKVTGWVAKIPLEATLKDILEYWRKII